MIQGIIIVNNHGKPRLVKFYQPVASEARQQSVIRRVFQQVSQRPDSFCNYLFLDANVCPEWSESAGVPAHQGGTKLIYRHYATLYFCFAVDLQESDLGILDLIQVFVEALDQSFENVCELDLIFHSEKVHYILDEIVMGGMVLETNIHAILQASKQQGQMHQASLSQTSTTTSTMTPSATSHAARLGPPTPSVGGFTDNAQGGGSSGAIISGNNSGSAWSYNW